MSMIFLDIEELFFLSWNKSAWIEIERSIAQR